LQGAAEFFRLWVHNEDYAKSRAPKYYALFEKKLTGHQIEDAVREFKREYMAIYDASPEERAANQVEFRGPRVASSRELLLKFETYWLNEYAPIKRAVREMNRLERDPERRRGKVEDLLGQRDMPDLILEDAFRLAELAKGSTIKARGFIDHGIKDYEGNPIVVRDKDGNVKKGAFVGGMAEAWKPVKEEAKQRNVAFYDYIETFAQYLVMRHAIETEASGRATGIKTPDAQAFIDKYETAAFRKAAENLYDFQSGLLDYAVNGGAIDLETANRMRSFYAYYVPLQRVIDTSEALTLGQGHAKRSGVGPVGQLVKARKEKGSHRTIINPLESIVKNTFTFVQFMESNRALTALTDQAMRVLPKGMEGPGQWIERVATPMKKVSVKRDVDRIRELAAEQGYEIPEDVDLSGWIEMFQPDHRWNKQGDGGRIFVYKNGKRESYKVNNAELLTALTTVGTASPEVFHVVFSGPSGLLRKTATSTLEFLMRNPARDTLYATVNSEYGFLPIVSTLHGLFEIFASTRAGKKLGLTAGEIYVQFMNSGAGGHTLGSLDRDTMREQTRRLGLDETSTMGAAKRLWYSTPHTAAEAVKGLQEAMENASRVGEFARALKKLEKQGKEPAEARALAAYSAAEITVNFKRYGTSAKTFNKYKAFFNASLQGKLRLVEVFYRRPVSSTLKALSSITTLSVLTWLINRDDEEYRELPDWERRSHWHIPLGRGPGHEWLTIPKPWELGDIFGNTVEAGLDFVFGYTDGEEAIKEMFPDNDSLWSAIMLILPTAIMPIIEVAFNRSFFRDTPIVSPYLANVVDPELQAGRYTSDTARRLAKAIGFKRIGAAHIDSFLQGYTAGLGRYATDILDQVWELGEDAGERVADYIKEVSPETEIDLFERGVRYPDLPKRGSWKTRAWGLRAFFKPSAARGGARSIQEFYELRDALRGIESTIRIHEENGNEGEADAVRQKDRDGPNLLGRKASLQGAERNLRRLRDRMDRIYLREIDSDETAIQRGEELDALWGDMVNVTRRFFGRENIEWPPIPN
jgi:hypothetical protein